MVCALTFFMVLLVPGDPAVTVAGPDATAEQIQDTRERLGLTDPLVVQFVRWLGNVFTGDLGQSLQMGTDVSKLIMQRFPVTFGLAALALGLSLLISIPAAVVASIARGSVADRLVTLLASLGIAMPAFWIGMILIISLSLRAGWLPSSGYVPFFQSPTEWLRFTIIPSIALAAAPTAEITRQLRASMIDILDQDYVRTARAKGLRSISIYGKHALKNAGVPVVTMIGLQTSFLLGGSAIIEQIFGIPGIGALSVNAVFQRDIPLIQGVVLVAGVSVLAVNLLVDLTYRYFNPKMRQL
jgi:peptide/nickel transport system permease protein